MELWLKRYLSLFFDFEYFGNLNWLAIPLLIYFLVTIKKRKRWEMAVAFIFIISCFLLEIRGGFWPRYIFTLYPFTLAAILLLGWELVKKKGSYLQIGILIICGIFVFYNYYHYKDTYKLFWRTKVSLSEDNFPHKTIEIINNIKDANSVFLICSHRHLFFYHTNKKGIDYRDPKLGIIYRQENKEAALDVLKNQLKVKYILLYWNYKLHTILMDIIYNYCDLVYRDKKFYLYKIRERKLDEEEFERLFVNDSLLKNGSFENWAKGPFNNPDFFKGKGIFKGMVTREEKEVRVDRYSARITGDSFNFAQDLSNFEDYRGKQLTCFVWVKTNVPNKYRIQIHDGVDSSTSKKHSGRGGWELLQANHTVNPSAKLVRVRVIQAVKTENEDAEVFIDGALLVEGYWNTFYLYKLHMQKKNLIEELSQK